MADQYDELLDRLDGVRVRGDQADARCPAHDDRKASLSVARGHDGRVLITCHAGCRWGDVLTAVNMVPSDAFGEPRIVAEYTYTDEAGQPLYLVERWEPKAFRQRMAGGQRRGPKDDERVLYNLPAVLTAKKTTQSLFFVEGEKDADTLAGLGYIATTTAGGAGKAWQPQYTEALAGLRVVIVADNDDTGKRWARQVAKHLRDDATPVLLAPPKGVKDVTELTEGNYPITALVPLANTHGEVVSAGDIPTKAVDWLWPGRLPANMLTLIEGDPGTGKSTLVAELIACLTTGRPLPGAARSKALRVAVLSDEDSWSSVVVPRLQAAGADLHRVLHMRGVRGPDGMLAPYSLTDLVTLREDVNAVHADLLVVDPLVAYLGGGTAFDPHKDSHVRSILGPLVQVAEEDGLTIIAVRHFTKGSVGGKAIYRGGGSIGFTGQARAILQTGEYPTQPDDEQPQQGRFVLAVAKCNMAPLAPSLGYRIEVDGRLDVGRIGWDTEPVPITASQLHRNDTEDNDLHRAGKEAIEWLTGHLAQTWRGEPYEWKTLLSAAREVGIAKNTLERVRSRVLMLRIEGTGGLRAARWMPITPPTSPYPIGGEGSGEVGKWDDDLSHRMDPSGYDDDDPESNSTEPTSPLPHLPASNGRAGSGPQAGNGKPQESNIEVPLPHFPTSPTECRICGSTDGLVVTADGDARCRNHNSLVWNPADEDGAG